MKQSKPNNKLNNFTPSIIPTPGNPNKIIKINKEKDNEEEGPEANPVFAKRNYYLKSEGNYTKSMSYNVNTMKQIYPKVDNIDNTNTNNNDDTNNNIDTEYNSNSNNSSIRPPILQQPYRPVKPRDSPFGKKNTLNAVNNLNTLNSLNGDERNNAPLSTVSNYYTKSNNIKKINNYDTYFTEQDNVELQQPKTIKSNQNIKINQKLYSFNESNNGNSNNINRNNSNNSINNNGQKKNNEKNYIYSTLNINNLIISDKKYLNTITDNILDNNNINSNNSNEDDEALEEEDLEYEQQPQKKSSNQNIQNSQNKPVYREYTHKPFKNQTNLQSNIKPFPQTNLKYNLQPKPIIVKSNIKEDIIYDTREISNNNKNINNNVNNNVNNIKDKDYYENSSYKTSASTSLYSNSNNTSNNIGKVSNVNNLTNVTANNQINNINNIIKDTKDTKDLKDVNKYYVNLEDLIILEENLSEILLNLKRNLPIYNFCYDWWNFYNYSTIFGTYQNFFKDEYSKEIIHHSTVLELISIILCYYCSSKPEIFNKLSNLLNPLIYLIHQNFLILCDYLVSKISQESISNGWVSKIMEIVLKKIYCKIKKGENVYYILENNKNIYKYLKSIIQNYEMTDDIFSELKLMLANISNLKLETLSEFFKNKVLIYEDYNSSVFASVLDNSNSDEDDDLLKKQIPFMKFSPKKSYTLVLDLDETLIHFRLDKYNENKGVLRIRPGLYEFLKELYVYFELVIFTASTQDYADPILNAIEGKNKFFDYRLYRHHARVINNCFVKDLSYIGRDLSRTIIIDNLPQNFILQKPNGIFIKSFFGIENDDTALYDLIPILKSIVKSNGDVRVMLEKFRSEIFRTISSNCGKLE